MEQLWMNKNEILNDLAEVSGPIDVANDLTSIHDRPPNKAAELDIETDLFLRMCGVGVRGAAGCSGTSRASELEEGCYPPPDLPNIQRMLQMLYDSEDLPNHNETENFTKKSNQKIVISKLNANVKAFVPKNIKKDISPEEDFAKLSINNNETKDDSEFRQIVFKDNNAQASEINDNIVIPKKVDVVETKRNRNVAMNSFNENAEATSNTIKLFTPDDFLLKPKITLDNLMAENVDRYFDSKILKEDTTNDSKGEELLCDVEHDPNIEVSPLEVQASIKKVSNWLEPKTTEPPKTNTPFLGTITYKKKERVLPTPDSQNVESSNSSVTPPQSTSYKPSPYAAELCQKFEKYASSSSLVKEDVWTKLQRELQEKDAELRRKVLEEEKSRSSPTPVQDKRKKKFRGRRLL